ncbi:Activator of Hsp90 ATPase -like protein [compost metagenome]
MEKRKNNEVFIEELFNASCERVFNAWTQPDQLMQWFAPTGCTISFKKLDIHPGGQFHSCVSNPQFGDCWCIGEYKEVLPNHKLVFSMINTDENGHPINPADLGMDPDWPGETLVTINFSEVGNKTRLTLHQTVSADLAKKTGAYGGWTMMFEKLNALLTK